MDIAPLQDRFVNTVRIIDMRDLRQEGNIGGDLLSPEGPDLLSVYQDFSVRVQHARNHPEQCRLPAPVRSEQTHARPFPYAKRHIPDHEGITAGL